MQEQPNDTRKTLGCGGALAIFAVGIAAIGIPLLAPADAESREAALGAFGPALLPGLIVGVVGAVRRRLRERRNEGPRTSLPQTAFWSLAVLGYGIARFAPPSAMGALAGFGSGVAIAFSITWTGTLFLARRSS